MSQVLLDAEEQPAPGRRLSPFAAPDAHVLAGDAAAQLRRLRFAVGVLAIEVSHDDRVGADVRRRDVGVGPHERLQLVHEAQ